MQVCKAIDGYIEEKYERQAMWIAKLSNGETVYQDDERPGLFENSAWIRLKEYVYANKLHIDNLTIRFRSHIISVNHTPVGGFFFRHAALGSFGSAKTVAFYLAGTIQNGILSVVKYRVPEIEVEKIETRDIQESI